MTWGVSTSSGRFSPAIRAFCAMWALALAALLPAPAMAKGPPVTRTATARATVVAPLTVVWVQDLKFGRIVPRPQSGTVTVDQITGACTVTGPILEVGKCQFAQFAGMGSKNMNARISLTNSTNLTGPGQAMVLDQIKLGTNSTISFAGNANANGRGVGLTKGGNGERYSITTSTGIYVLNIGGRLTVNANQAPGTYNGTITISVQYQ
jgi:spore coat protein U-like protein